jgi:hypothetical protein
LYRFEGAEASMPEAAPMPMDVRRTPLSGDRIALAGMRSPLRLAIFPALASRRLIRRFDEISPLRIADATANYHVPWFGPAPRHSNRGT